jgi:hypothetical protein
MSELWSQTAPARERPHDIQVETTTDSQRAIDGMADGDQDAAKATPDEAFAGFSQSADKTVLSFENPLGNSRSYMEQDVAELEAAAAGTEIPVDSNLEPEPESAEDAPAEGSKTVRQLAEEDALRHARAYQDEQFRLQMVQQFGGQWLAEGEAQFEARVDELRKTVPDFNETMKTNRELVEALEARPNIADAVKYIRGGVDAVYFLAKNRAAAQELLRLPDSVAVARVGQLAAELYSPPTAGRVTRVSNAPAPITPVRNSATKSSVPLDQLPYSDYRRIRDAQSKARFKR